MSKVIALRKNVSIFDLDPACIDSERDLISFGRSKILELRSWSFHPERLSLGVQLGDMKWSFDRRCLSDSDKVALSFRFHCG